ncbi:Nuclear pore complex protein Nup107 [Thelohanellus kitauei]|uniref:Nuclear pore complex protein n=1 Tax=Thelohanellus kitauei TaxID=669202 RepID=A0A0C2I9Z5_THEKT|nr:Nuclear pore complex protein Nup107 [Thelohanellus kitauei]
MDSDNVRDSQFKFNIDSSLLNLVKLVLKAGKRRHSIETEADYKFMVEDASHVEFKFIETLLLAVPPEIPKHHVLGETKIKTQSKDDCLHMRFALLCENELHRKDPDVLLQKYSHITKEMYDSFFKASVNSIKFNIDDSVISNLKKLSNTLFMELETWQLAKNVINFVSGFEERETFESNILKEIENLSTNNFKYKYFSMLLNWLEQSYLTRQSMEISRNIDSVSHDCTWRSYSQKFLNNERLAHRHITPKLDPDATTRLNLPICQEDSILEDFFHCVLFKMYRSGNHQKVVCSFKKVQNLCNLGDQTWRLPSLIYLPMFDPNFNVGELPPAILLCTYQLWHDSCLKMSNDDFSNQFERAIYGILTGNIDAIYPVCDTYNDYLWANITCYIVKTIEEKILKFLNPESPKNHDLEMFKIGKILKNISKLSKTLTGEERFFHALQKYIITMDPNIFQKMQKYSFLLVEDHILRFYTHFVLLYKNFTPIPDDLIIKILSTYIDHLIGIKKFEIVPLYVSFMPKSVQVIKFVHCLKTIKPVDKKQFLKHSEIYNLDTVAICRSISLSTSNKYLSCHYSKSQMTDNHEQLPEALDCLEYPLLYQQTHCFAGLIVLKVCDTLLASEEFELVSKFLHTLPKSLLSKIKQEKNDKTQTTLLYYKLKYLSTICELESLVSQARKTLKYDSKCILYFPSDNSETSYQVNICGIEHSNF